MAPSAPAGLLLAALLLQTAAALQVSSVRELHAALQSGAATEVDVMTGASPEAWHFRDGDWPSQVVLERAVTLNGADASAPPYWDANQLTELVVVRGAGSLRLRNLRVDDCLLPVMPLLCVAAGSDNGSVTVEGGELGDATCTDIQHSVAADWLLKSAYWATWQSRWTKQDRRTIWVEDTGEVTTMPHGMRWRIVNTTLRCTGNETHPLPWLAPPGAAQHSDTQLMMAMAATLLAVLALTHYALNRNVVYVHAGDSVEVVVARTKGIVLQALIGQGTFGRVYRGQYRGATVAIKVVDFPMHERRAAAEVARECQHAMACRHPAIVRCFTHFTVIVRTQLRRAHGARALGNAELAYAHEQLLQAPPQEARGARAAHPQQPSASAAAAAQGLAAAPGGLAEGGAAARRRHAAAAAAGPPGSSGSGGGGQGTSGSASCAGGATESFMALLVMDYCVLGNLHRSIAAGRFFLSRRSQQPNLDWVCRTARDVAEGLAHLHDELQMVHRDVSTNNVLLVPDPADPRGFRAQLADFGLSTVLRDRQTHKTSQLKGTVDFMPPEIFTCGEIRFAVDIYGLGIMVYWMCLGEGPYTGLAPFQVVGRKLEEVHRKQRLLLPPTMPQELRHLVWDCCHWDPRERPTAAKVASWLTELTLQNAEERFRRQMAA